MVIRRGDVWWVDLGVPQGSEPAFTRPVIIVQSDLFNQSNIKTYLVIALTRNRRLLDIPGNILVPRRESGLPHDCVANFTQLATVNQHQLVEHVKALPALVMAQVDEGLRLVLNL